MSSNARPSRPPRGTVSTQVRMHSDVKEAISREAYLQRQNFSEFMRTAGLAYAARLYAERDGEGSALLDAPAKR